MPECMKELSRVWGLRVGGFVLRATDLESRVL